MDKRGVLIVLEGVDKVGKTTQCKKLVQTLQQNDIPSEMIVFPDRTTMIGQLINSYLKKRNDLNDRVLHLLFSANRWEIVPLIKKKLNQGITLVVDRYAFSGVAFSSAKPDFIIEWCKAPDIGLPKPDLVLFLQLQSGVCLGNDVGLGSGFGEERYETDVFQSVVNKIFDQLITDPSVNWKMIDASQSVENVHNNILTHSLDIINRSQYMPLGELWV